MRRPLALVAAVVSLAACAESAIPSATTAASPATQVTPLPELPPLWVLYPDEYDENGCLIEGPNKVECPPPPPPGAPIEEDDPSDPTEWRSLLGFEGPYYVGTLTAGDVVVIPESVTTSTSGTWRAWGLVRNETGGLSDASVTASLLSADGTLLAEVTAPVLVDALRPGEPGPFVLESAVAAGDVADVNWAVTSTPPASTPVRDLQILAPIWDIPYGEWSADAPLVAWKDPPLPYVALGDVENLSADVVQQPHIAAAWLDPDGRVVWVETTLVGEVPHDPEFSEVVPNDLAPRHGGIFYIAVSDSQVGPRLGMNSSETAPMFWAWGSAP